MNTQADIISFAVEIQEVATARLWDAVTPENCLSMSQVCLLQCIEKIFCEAGINEKTAPAIIALWEASGLTY